MIEVDYLIVGAGVAGVQAALAARQQDPDGSIVLINGESSLPYKRTKLSKCLHPGYQHDDFTLFPQSYYLEQRIDLVADWLTAHRLADCTAHGRFDYRYRKLVLACGARYTVPPCWQSPRTLSLRQMADGLALQRLAAELTDVTVLGAGVEGLELASAYAGSHRVRLIERGKVPLPTLASRTIQRRLLEALQRAGVDFYAQESLNQVETGVAGLRLEASGGSHLTTDLLLLATGTRAGTPLLPCIPGQAAGQVDSYLRWSDQVYVAGDLCTLQGRRCQLWHEAESLGAAAGKNAALALLGREQLHYQRKIFRTKLECFGLYLFLAQPTTLPACCYQYAEGDRYYQLWLHQGRLVGANMMGDAPRAKVLQQLLWQQVSLETAEQQLSLARSQRKEGP